jgi:hypothetical protein
MVNLLKKLADIQYKYKLYLLIFYLVITLILGVGILNLQVEPDINKGMPQQLEVYQLKNQVSDEFGGEDIVIVMLKIDEATDKDSIYDIRDPQIINFLIEFQNELEKNPKVVGVTSAASIFSQLPHETYQETIYAQELVPDLVNFYDDEYKVTLAYIYVDIGVEYSSVKSFENMIYETIDSIGPPGNVEISISGTPSIFKSIYEFLISDAINTLIIASILIFLMLIIIQRDLIKSILIFLPIIFAIIWMMGTMGYIGLRLSIATAGLGAILLGLGIEYGVFMTSRFYEEYEKSNTEKEALENTVSSVGGSIFGSGLTTIVGFVSLGISIIPMMADLGYSLALGIGYSILAVIFVTPVFILIIEEIRHNLIEKKVSTLNKKISTRRRKK